QHRRVVHLLPAPQGGQQGTTVDPHVARGRVRAAPAVVSDLPQRAATELDPGWEPRWQWWGGFRFRVNLVAGVLGLVTLALCIVGTASVVWWQACRLDRVDEQLRAVEEPVTSGSQPQQAGGFLPSDFIFAQEQAGGTGVYATQFISRGQLPDIPQDLSTWRPRVGDFFTVPSIDRHGSWRVLVSEHEDGRDILVAEDLSDVEYA